MSAPTNSQIFNGPYGEPEYAQHMAELRAEKLRDPDYIPHEVVGRTVDGATPVMAWRDDLGFAQAEVAAKLGITQGAYAQQEASNKLRKSSREEIAAALDIAPQQLDW